MPETRRKYDPEFREGAVRIVRETGKPIAQVARGLGLNEDTLDRWVNLNRRAREGEGPLSESERDELNRPRMENAELAMERCGQALGGPLVIRLTADELSEAVIDQAPHDKRCARPTDALDVESCRRASSSQPPQSAPENAVPPDRRTGSSQRIRCARRFRQQLSSVSAVGLSD